MNPKMVVESVQQAIRFARGIVVPPSNGMPGMPIVIQMGEASAEEAKAILDMATGMGKGNPERVAEIVREYIGVGVA